MSPGREELMLDAEEPWRRLVTLVVTSQSRWLCSIPRLHCSRYAAPWEDSIQKGRRGRDQHVKRQPCLA